MPTYGYKCRECETEFDVVQKINDDPPKECPKCGGPVKRVFHPVGIIFKGSGFYTTDYKNKQTNPAPMKSSDDVKKGESPDKKSEASKPKPKESNAN